MGMSFPQPPVLLPGVSSGFPDLWGDHAGFQKNTCDGKSENYMESLKNKHRLKKKRVGCDGTYFRLLALVQQRVPQSRCAQAKS